MRCLTGARPARTGIIANNWFDPGIARADKKVYCAEDERDPAADADPAALSSGPKNSSGAAPTQSLVKTLVAILSMWFLMPVVFIFFLLD